MKKILLTLLFALLSVMSYAQLNKQACQEIFNTLNVKNNTTTLATAGSKYDISEAEITFKETYLQITNAYYREYQHRTYTTNKNQKYTVVIPYNKIRMLKFSNEGYFIISLLE